MNKSKIRIFLYYKPSLAFQELRRPAFLKCTVVESFSSIDIALLKPVKLVKTIVLLCETKISTCLFFLLRRSIHKTLTLIKTRNSLPSLALIKHFQSFRSFVLNPYDFESWKGLFHFRNLCHLSIRLQEQHLPYRIFQRLRACCSRFTQYLRTSKHLKGIEIKGSCDKNLVAMLSKLNSSLSDSFLAQGEISIDIDDYQAFSFNLEETSQKILSRVSKLRNRSFEGSTFLNLINKFPKLFNQLAILHIEIINFDRCDLSVLEKIQLLPNLRKFCFSGGNFNEGNRGIDRFFHYFSLSPRIDSVILSLSFVDWAALFPKSDFKDIHESPLMHSPYLNKFFSSWERVNNLQNLTIFLTTSSIKYKANFAKAFTRAILTYLKSLTYLSLHFDGQVLEEAIEKTQDFDPYEKEEEILKLSEFLSIISPLSATLKKVVLNFPIVSLGGLRNLCVSRQVSFTLEELDLLGIHIGTSELDNLTLLCDKTGNLSIADIWIQDSENNYDILGSLTKKMRGTLSVMAIAASADDVLNSLLTFIADKRKSFLFSLEYQIGQVNTQKLKQVGDLLLRNGTFERLEIKTPNRSLIYSRNKQDYVIYHTNGLADTLENMLDIEEGSIDEVLSLQEITWIEPELGNDGIHNRDESIFN